MSRNAQVVRQWLLLERLERSKGASIDEFVESLPPDYPRNPSTETAGVGLDITAVNLAVQQAAGGRRSALFT